MSSSWPKQWAGGAFGVPRSCRWQMLTAVALPGGDLMLGDNAELLVRGPCVMRGYWKRPQVDTGEFADDAHHEAQAHEFDRSLHLGH